MNYPEFPDSCLRIELAFVVDVLEVLVDGPDVLAVEIGHQLLREPDRPLGKARLDVDRTVVTHVDQKLAGGGDEVFGIAGHSVASLAAFAACWALPTDSSPESRRGSSISRCPSLANV